MVSPFFLRRQNYPLLYIVPVVLQVFTPACAGLHPCPLFRAYPNSGCMTALIGPFVLIVFFARLFLPAITKNALRTLALRTLWPF
jgi:hypothetical protein